MPVFHELAAALAGQRILIAGGSGFVGKWLTTALSALTRHGTSAEVTILCRHPEALCAGYPEFAALPLRFIAADVTRMQLADARWDYVIHAANDTGPNATAAPEELVRTIVDGTRRVLDHAVGARARGFLLLSSGAVYGPMPADVARYPEDFSGTPNPADPATAYGHAKRLAECLCAVYHQRFGLPVKIARGFSFAGEYLRIDGQLAFGNFIRDAIDSGEIVVRGTGTPVRSYLYGGDMALWLLKILVSGAPVRPYNVGSDRAISVAELAHQIMAELTLGKTVKIEGRTGSEVRTRYVPDVERARTELGLDVWTDLPTTIRRTAAYAVARSTDR